MQFLTTNGAAIQQMPNGQQQMAMMMQQVQTLMQSINAPQQEQPAEQKEEEKQDFSHIQPPTKSDQVFGALFKEQSSMLKTGQSSGF